MNVLIFLAVVLILAVGILLFRTSALLAVARGSDEKKGGLLNKFNAAMFLIFFVLGMTLFIWYTFGYKDKYLLPVSASAHGVGTDSMMMWSLAIISVPFVGVSALLFYFSWKYQYREDQKAEFFPDNSKLEMLWTVIPAIVLTILVYNGWKQWTDITNGPSTEEKAKNKPVELEIVAQQFQWSVRYPGLDGKLGEHNFKRIDGTNSFGIKVEDKNGLDDFMPIPVDAANADKKAEIHIPVGKAVHLKIRAKDVLHSVFAPHFRVKMDAVPGNPTEFWFTPTITTREMRNKLQNQEFNYEVACTEICGPGHFNMKAVIIVETQEEYDKWYAAQAAKPWTLENKDYVAEQLNKYGAKFKDEYLSIIDKFIALSAPKESTETAAPAADSTKVEEKK